MGSLASRRIDLGDTDPAGSRQLGRRSAVHVAGETIVAGTASGDLVGVGNDGSRRWLADGGDGSVVSIASRDDSILVGERGPSGLIRCLDGADGTRNWCHETATDVGRPQKETRFFLPFVVDIVTDGDRWYVASRRYYRRGQDRQFRSVVAAFGRDGTVAWRYESDASPIGLDVSDERLAVAYNRCPGSDQPGLVVLETATGRERYTWDPGTDGQRRVGDVALLDDGAVVGCHGDYAGYRLDGGTVRWRVPLATPTSVDGETVYAYPNHVHATGRGVAFVTGNTYPAEGRETDARHPREHTVAAYGPDGDRNWTAPVEGFATEIGTAGDRLAVPTAQHFRDRTAEHGFGLFDIVEGSERRVDTAGVVTATSVDRQTVAAVEEPVSYHDREGSCGSYRLHVESV